MKFIAFLHIKCKENQNLYAFGKKWNSDGGVFKYEATGEIRT